MQPTTAVKIQKLIDARDLDPQDRISDRHAL